MKKKMLVSFSGGETSAFMGQWLWKHKRDEYDMIFVFANTGQENEETLEFTKRCSEYFGFPIVWVEAKINEGYGNGTSHTVVDFDSASRNGEPFEAFIKKYGIPNQANPQCTRELKGAVIQSYAKSVGFGKCYTAIGIRVDEFDRMNEKRKEKRLIYPLIQKDMIPTTKPMVNFFWANMPFRLNLKGYEGNCKWCWKKSRLKLIRIAVDNPEHFDFPKRMEATYGNFFPEQRIQKWNEEGKEIPTNITFFRGHTSANDILEIAKMANPRIKDDAAVMPNDRPKQITLFEEEDFDLMGGESCEVWSACGEAD